MYKEEQQKKLIRYAIRTAILYVFIVIITYYAMVALYAWLMFRSFRF